MHSKPPIHPYIGIIIGLPAVSAASLIINAALQAGAPPLVVAAYRLAFASLALAPLAWARYRPELLRLTRRDWLLAAGAGLFLGLHFGTWITSLQYTTIASSVVLVSASPLFVGLFSWLLWRERFGRGLLAGLALTMIGAALVGLADACALTGGNFVCPPVAQFVQGRAFVGDLLALAGAAAFAGYLLIGRALRAKLSLVAYIFIGYSAAAITLLLTVFARRIPLFGYSPTAYFWIVVLALVPQLIGHSAFNWALRYLSATYVAVTILGEPIGSTVLAFFLLQQVPTPLKLLGGAFILVGILLASRQRQ